MAAIPDIAIEVLPGGPDERTSCFRDRLQGLQRTSCRPPRTMPIAGRMSAYPAVVRKNRTSPDTAPYKKVAW